MPRSSTSSLDQVRAEQLARLRRRLPEVLRGNGFWSERLHDVNGWDDFQRLPLTGKEDLVQDQARHPPFGSNLTYPLDRYVRVHQTSGSTGGRPLRWLDTPESWEWWCRLWAEHVYAAARVGPDDRVFLAFSFGPFVGFWSAFAGAERLGALVISGGAMSSEQRIVTMLELGATVLLCTPTYALRLAELSGEMGVDLAASAIRATIHAGEPGGSVPATREAIERAYGAVAFDHTGMTELGPTGFSCAQRDGVHLIETEFVFEVLPQDPLPDPPRKGEGDVAASTRDEGEGELVATNLGRWGSPLFRYRTGDRVHLSRAPCGCGSTFPKLVGGLQGRVDDMITVRGVNLFPSQVEDVVRRHPEIGEFVIEHRRVREMDEVTLLVECARGEAPLAGLGVELRNALGVRIECRQVAAGSLPRSELKARRLSRLPG
jgi:phenylacetate-CoA ligase